MELFLDQFEREKTLHFSYSVDPEDGAKLFDDIEVELASPIEVELDVERVDTTFVVDSDISARLAFVCGRCLAERTKTFSLQTQWVLMSRGAWLDKYGDVEEVELNEDDLDVSFYEGESLIIDELVREALLLELSGQLRCPEGDSDCDAAYRENVGEEAIEENEESSVDLRWAPLKNIKLADNEE